MPPKRGGAGYYDDDDLDDGYDDWEEQEDEEEGEWEDEAAALEASKAEAAQAAAATAAAAAGGLAGASALAAAVCGPPPLRPDGRPQRGATPEPTAAANATPAFPLVPPAMAAMHAAAAARGFKFDTPSPDDAVLAAQSGKSPATSSQGAAGAGVAGGGKPNKSLPGVPGLPQSKFLSQPTPAQAKHAQRTAAAASAAPAAAAGGGQGAAGTADRAEVSAPTVSAVATRRRVGEYEMEAELVVACADAAEAEGAGSSNRAASDEDANAPRPGLHLVVLGHVDAGKSTLMGRLLHEVGVITAKDVHRNTRDAAAAGKASFSWAWALDERPEERARGVTVDVAMQRFRSGRYNVTLLDAPGHRDFVPNAIAGAAQADAALLLVDGTPGGFEAGFEGSGGELSGGQTKEHAQLARSLGIEQLAVVVSKLDTCDYSQERFDEIRSVLGPFLKSCGFRDSSVQWLPAVGPSGENLVSPPTAPQLAAWFVGPSVLGAIDAFVSRERALDKPCRMPVSDVTRTKAGAAALGGKLEGGVLCIGSHVVLVPGVPGCGPGTPAVVRAIDVDGHPARVARAGDSVEVVLQGADLSNVPHGAVLCHADYAAPLVTRFEARVVVLDAPVPVLRGTAVTLHAHTAREEGHVSALLSALNPKTGEPMKIKPRCLVKGQTGVIEVTAARSLVLEEYGDYKALGRIALREGGRTVAVGVVTKLME